MSDTLEPKAPPVAEDLGFDPEALKARYRAERDKRLRSDANEQYVNVVGGFAHYLEDPYVAPLTRESSRSKRSVTRSPPFPTGSF
jgi:cyclohexanone monooxygenase